MELDRDEYIRKVVGFLVPSSDREAWEALTLDGVYSGASPYVRRLVEIAYRRGVRRGAAAAWSARQPAQLRREEPSGEES